MTSKIQQQILIHYGEVALKGKNQPRFRRMLQRNVHLMLKQHGFRATVRQTRGYLSVGLEHVAKHDHVRVLDLIKNVFGIIWYTRAFRIPYQMPVESHFSEIHEQITGVLLLYADKITDPQNTYCVRVRRSDKRFPVKSVVYERELGTFIKENTRLSRVDLENPDHTFYVEVQSGEIYVYSDKLPGYQ
jgi:thiamine biosynthesis protein ThiI